MWPELRPSLSGGATVESKAEARVDKSEAEMRAGASPHSPPASGSLNVPAVVVTRETCHEKET